jgi:hypothetical protein
LWLGHLSDRVEVVIDVSGVVGEELGGDGDLFGGLEYLLVLSALDCR